MGTVLHEPLEDAWLEAEALRDHAGDIVKGSQHEFAPGIHHLLPLRKLVGDHFLGRQLGVLGALRPRPDPPEEAPLGIRAGRGFGDGPILHVVPIVQEAVVAGLLHASRRDADLVGHLRPRVADAIRHRKVSLHHVEKALVFFLVHPRIADHQSAVLAHRHRSFDAFRLSRCWIFVSGQKSAQVDHRQLRDWRRGLLHSAFAASCGLATSAPQRERQRRAASERAQREHFRSGQPEHLGGDHGGHLQC
mmetsp:Transcript_3668/g.14427  ORF Transcript_3668/g.14427 Transcript_3668/m.14427 type:complete len:248 (+) Transcript_3668:1157-1900(+)